MNLGKTVFVAVLCLSLGAYLYFIESEKMQRDEVEKQLFDFETGLVNGLHLESGGKSIVLAKTAEGWTLQQPVEAKADDAAVDNLVKALVEAERKRSLSAEGEDRAELATFGLEPPEAIVRLRLEDGRDEIVVRVGKVSPVGYSTFLQIEGQSDIVLVPSAVHYGMKKELKDLRDKVIVSIDQETVSGLRIEEGGEVIALERDDKGRWNLREPVQGPADGTEVKNFLDAVESLRAQDFADPATPDAELGLDPPTRHIRIDYEEDAESLELLVGPEPEGDGDVQAWVRPGHRSEAYAIAKWARSSLDKTLREFRDKTLLRIPRESIASIRVQRRGEEPYTLRRAAAEGEEAWELEGATATRSGQVVQFVTDLGTLAGFEVADEAPEDLGEYGLAEPALVFELLDAEGALLGRVEAARVLGPDEDSEESFARSTRSPVIQRIRNYVYSHIDKQRDDFVESSDEAEAAVEDAGSAEAAD